MQLNAAWHQIAFLNFQDAHVHLENLRLTHGGDRRSAKFQESNLSLEKSKAESGVRRHLTTSQRAMIAAEMANLEKGGKAGVRKSNTSNEVLITQPVAAKTMNVSLSSVQRAAEVKREAPQLAREVKAGKMKLSVNALRISTKLVGLDWHQDFRAVLDRQRSGKA